MAPSNPLKANMDGAAKAWQHHWAQASSGTIVPVGTQPKRQNPSKIQAKRVASWSAEPVPFGTFEPAKSKDGWGCEGLAAPLGPSIEWNHSTGGHAAETAEPQQDWQSRCRLAPSNPLKAKMDGAAKAWQHHWALAQASSGTIVPVGTQPTAGPQQDSRPTACHLVGRAAVTGEHAAETAEPQQDSGQTGCHLVGRAGAVWHLRTR